MLRQIKNKTITKNSLIPRVFETLTVLFKLCFKTKIFKVFTATLLLGYGLINSILFYAITKVFSSGNIILIIFFMLLIISFNVFSVYTLMKSLFSLTKIMKGVKEISKGNLGYSLNDDEISVAFSDFACDIESIQLGLKKAVDEAIKGERMKTELITNVSHDLKTPLTSIVNYVDLLKKEDLNNQKATNYINILEEKSSRLKQLIEDLIEASKASSGNLHVNTEKIDLNELVMQALGEYQERLKNALLDVHIKNADEKVLIFADGKHMWRIVENLITNVIKYSMPKSRVYVEIDQSDKYGILIIKNISTVPLDISPEQLTERFVRGDVSRNTEGSGLGLSIAQSLANLQHGDFKIEIDGDLFKVIVRVPLCENIQ
jgi:signal transduction histidine kinase